MKKLLVLILVLLLAASIFAATGCGQKPQPAEAPKTEPAKQEYGPPATVTTWRFQPIFQPTDAGWNNGVVPWARAVEEATKGTVKIELLPGGSITSAAEAFRATMAGMIDVYAGWATVYGGDMPEGMLAYGIAMGAENHRDAWAAMWGDPKYRIGELVQTAANERNLHWVGWSSQGPNVALTNFPVRRLEDFAGRKMRAGAPQAIFHKALGGTPVVVPGAEIYMAIKLGTIEGTYWDAGGSATMKFHEVTDYMILPGWCPAQHQEIYVNLDRWKALNQWQRDRISEIFMPVYFETSRLHLANLAKSKEIFVNEGKGQILNLPSSEVERLRKIVREQVWPQVAAQSPRNAKGVELWTQFLVDIGTLKN
ncbi:MAG: TRAP transporter substrate-binding protein DctP [Syntrophomonadaceae bacterium]|nr:TRAP transporter substrate-binding protein DctP [Syntrophomonadaceae bacterium]